MTKYVLIGLLLLAAVASADVPQLLNVQGVLTDTNGDPVADGTYSVLFSIYTVPNGGVSIWNSTRSVSTVNGLFTIILGEQHSLPYSIFENTTLYLGIKVESDPEMTPLMHLTSAPFAMKAPGVGGSGWVDDGSTVRLETSSDKVGIGTSSPSAKLDVAGEVFIRDTLKLGDVSNNGNFSMYINGSAEPVIQALDFMSMGTLIILKDESGNFTHSLAADINGVGGFLSVSRDALGHLAFVVDGNYGGSQNAYMGVFGDDRSAIFNMDEAGDSSVLLPDNAVSKFEILDEAGCGNTYNYTSYFSLSGTSVHSVLDRLMLFPTDGYAFVTATADLQIFHYEGVSDVMYFGLSDLPASSGFPYGTYTLNVISNMVTGTVRKVITIQTIIPVQAGFKTIRFLGQRSYGGSAYIYDRELTVLFFPTSYAAILKASPDGGMDTDMTSTELIDGDNPHAMRSDINALKTELNELKKQLNAQKQQGK